MKPRLIDRLLTLCLVLDLILGLWYLNHTFSFQYHLILGLS
ncbi:MAG: hypothetical protein ACUVXF_01165 [Desulfobaccales bacterium]